MLQQRKPQISKGEHEWIKSVLGRDLIRFPKLESFDNDELKMLINHWDNIFVRWLRKFYRPMGIEVEHEPENQTTPIRFSSLPGQDVDLPDSLRQLKLNRDQVRDIIDTDGWDGVVNYYMEARLLQLANASSF